MPLLNNYNNRPQMALDIPHCRTVKGQKSISFLGLMIWNKLRSNIKTAATTASFTHRMKKEILTKLHEWAILLTFYYCYFIYLFIYLFFDSWLFFYCISLSSYLLGKPNGNKNRFGSFLGHPRHLRSRGISCFSYASLIFNYLIM